MAEDSYHSRTSAFVLEQPDSAAFLIVDEAHMERPQMPLIQFIDGWETVEEMESGLGIPDGNLVATLNRYNEYAAAWRRSRLPQAAGIPCAHKTRDHGGHSTCRWAQAMYSGFHPGRSGHDVDGEVLREDGSVIPGLYAAGACASNIAQDGKGYASGTQLGEGSFFGRRAGAHAAKQRA